MLQGKYEKGKTPRELSSLDDVWQSRVLKQLDIMVESAVQDWEKLLGKPTMNYQCALSGIHKCYNQSTVTKLLKGEKENEVDGDVFITAIEIGVICGKVIIELNRNWGWIPCMPYWESPLYHSKSGCIANVFHWGVKKLSSYAVEDDLYGKCLACNEVAEKEFANL